jgi:release factor glutamine methyltransferase
MYEPREDSYLMAKHLAEIIREYKPSSFLDMGCGSGIQSQVALKAGIKKENILAVDIDQDALEETKKLGIKVLKSNLFDKIGENKKFDLIVFNAPYLPEDEHDKGKDTTGGKEGYEIISRFLKQAKEHLAKEGKILLLFSSLTNKKKVQELVKKQDFSFQEISKEKFFMEEIYLWVIERF